MYLLIDIGSTYTKLVCVNTSGDIIAAARSPTTVETDVNEGLKAVREEAERQAGQSLYYEKASLSSSAAGGLKMVVVGLVPVFTVEAARRAALGAGAKVLATYSYELTNREACEIETLAPDIVLLAGGTDGGDQRVLLHNAVVLAGKLPEGTAVLVGGNKVCTAKALEVLRRKGRALKVYFTENIMPELNRLNIEPAREAIRSIFLERIVKSKGVAEITRTLPRGKMIMPTPVAVMRAAELLAKGTGDQAGLGNVVVIDVGGATTDVHSVGEPVPAGRLFRGLPELFVKRTVEGDLGIRCNAMTLATFISEGRLQDRFPKPSFRDSSEELERYAGFVSRQKDYLPKSSREKELDVLMGTVAGALALERHAGRLEEVPTAQGLVEVQIGKDLSQTALLIGTGGVFNYSGLPGKILSGVLQFRGDPQTLRPADPELRYDAPYALFAAGLMREVDEQAAFRLALNCLAAPAEIETDGGA